MKFLRSALLLVVAAFILYVKFASLPPSTPSGSAASSSVPQSVDRGPIEAGVPDKAVKVLQIVRRTGEAPEGYVGGRVFQNREGHLPAEGDYREFDVDPHNGGRNAERLIVEWNTKKAWYTGDHYQTFTPLP
jgi:ribonuclease T1